jgi:methyltransferase (TIGR00027 family)
MKQQQSSTTAEGMALTRAIESAKPADKRICYDPIARSLVSGFKYTLSKLAIDLGLYASAAPGAIEFIIARERYIDDYLSACLREGLDQVVILGAGFDTRPYRIPGIEKTKVFEIDYAATQAEKQKRLKKTLKRIPEYVTFIPTDFSYQTLEDVLLSTSYDKQGKTLFIWQGVTAHLTTGSVDSTLTFITKNTGPGSSVIFDYFYNETLRDATRPEVQNKNRTAKVTGEAYLFGIDKGKAAQFLTQRGFQDIHNVDAEDLQKRYFTGPNAGRVVAEGAAIVSARVNKTA